MRLHAEALEGALDGGHIAGAVVEDGYFHSSPLVLGKTWRRRLSRDTAKRTARVHDQIKRTVSRHQFEHMVEEADSSGDASVPAAVQIEFQADVRLVCFAMNVGSSRHFYLCDPTIQAGAFHSFRMAFNSFFI